MKWAVSFFLFYGDQTEAQRPNGIKTKVTQPSVGSRTPPRSWTQIRPPCTSITTPHTRRFSCFGNLRQRGNNPHLKMAKVSEKGRFINVCLDYFANFKAEQITSKAKHKSESKQDGPLLWKVSSFPRCSHHSVPVLSHVFDFASCYCVAHGATQREESGFETKRTESARNCSETKRTLALPTGWPRPLFDLFFHM